MGRETADRSSRQAAVAAHARTATAARALSPSLAWWTYAVDAGVAFAEVPGAWVAAGEPIAAAETIETAASAFVAAARAARRRAVFFATEGALAHSDAFARLRLGEQPFWIPSRWVSKVAAHRSVKEQLRRARAKHVRVRESTDDRERITAAEGNGPLAALVTAWAAARPMATMRFIVHPEPFALRAGRRLFIAERDGTPVALLSLVPMGPHAWLVEHLLRAPQAPNGTAETLVDAVMRQVATEGAQAVTLGLAPLAGDVTWWLKIARTLARPLFNFEGLAAFKRKLRPDAWHPVFLVYPAGGSSMRGLIDALRAFAGGSLLRFGLASVWRGPAWVLRLLEWMLVPWTLALIAAPSAPWFPTPTIHAAWVLFDVALVAALRWRRKRSASRLTPWLAGAVACDFILTTVQALWWNLPRLRGAADACLMVVGLGGPLLAAVVLTGAARRERGR